jgi:hypothetical protein
MSSVEILKPIVLKWCEKHNIPRDHGYDHFCKVYEWAKMATLENCNNDERDCIELAAFLHDVDDPKIVTTENYANARYFLAHVGKSSTFCETVIHMISLVSASKNGNNLLKEIKEENGLLTGSKTHLRLVPRDCDRIEGLDIGRCIAYSERIGNPLWCPSDPICVTLSDLKTEISKRSMAEYKGKSKSVLGHFFDKLFHIKCSSGDDYLVDQFADGMQELYNFYIQVSQVLILLQDPSKGLTLKKPDDRTEKD